MCFSQIELTTQMSGRIKWLLIDKMHFINMKKNVRSNLQKFETKHFLFLFYEYIKYLIFRFVLPCSI